MHDINTILKQDKYIPRSELFCHDLIETKYLQQTEYHNKQFIKNKLKEYEEYFDNILDKEKKKIKLDLEQRIAILTDEDYNLIIAGAGSGKTTTMIAKIKYLIEKCHVSSNEILAISFARKNVLELDQKLNQIYKLNVDTKTFHKLGIEIIKAYENIPVRVISENDKKNIILNYLKKEIYKNKENLRETINFLSCYFHADPNMAEFDNFEEYKKYKYDTEYMSLKSNLGEYNKTIINKRKKSKISIKYEFLRSYQELEIANFLYLNNIEYEYEKKYPFSDNNTVYYPDFTIKQGENIIYLEHFAINQNGTSEIFDTQTTTKYNHEIDIKKQLHDQYHTKLICTYANYNDGKSLLFHLKELLIKNGFILKKKREEEIYQKLFETSKDTEFFAYLVLALSFISKFKLQKKKIEDFDRMISETDIERTKEFLKLTKKIYEHYEQTLKNEGKIDFEDMIIKAIYDLKHIKKENIPFHYQYIIVDEYQDISDQRFELLQELTRMLNSKIIAVGDDWQSIFAFAGSNVTLFTKFKEAMGYAEILKIQNTYRNSQELIDVASEFVEKNKEQIHKELRSNIHLKTPVIIYSYDDNDKKTWNKAMLISKIISDIKKEYSTQHQILLIGRYNFDIENLFHTNLFQKGENDKISAVNEPDMNITFSTAHGSKGSEFDSVIIINAIDSTFGFPSKIKDDPVFLAIENKPTLEYAEERRLFYVALTRTKSRVYIIVPTSKPSPFVIELKKNNNVKFMDNVIQEYQNNWENLKCPKCGYYLKKEYFNEMQQYIYRCTNEKEVCNFMTTELVYKVPIQKCSKCSGYMILKKVIPEKNLLMIGCTNYNDEEMNCMNVKYIPNTSIN